MIISRGRMKTAHDQSITYSGHTLRTIDADFHGILLHTFDKRYFSYTSSVLVKLQIYEHFLGIVHYKE